MGTGCSQAVCSGNAVRMVQAPSPDAFSPRCLHPTSRPPYPSPATGRGGPRAQHVPRPPPQEGKFGLRSNSKRRSEAPFVIQAAFPCLRARLPIQNLLACNLLSSGMPVEGELTGKRKQTNKLQKQRAGDAVDPDDCQALGYPRVGGDGQRHRLQRPGWEKALKIPIFLSYLPRAAFPAHKLQKA